MTSLACHASSCMTTAPTCSRVDQTEFVAVPGPVVARLTRAETAVIRSRVAKVNDVLASLYHVRGADVRFRFEILRERDRLQLLAKTGRPTSRAFDALAKLSSAAREATRDYAKVVASHANSSVFGRVEGYDHLARRLSELLD